jgi:hypothetical protein
MGWKKFPTWLKGGIILGVISLLYSIFFNIALQLGFVLPLFFFMEWPMRLASLLFGWGDLIMGWRGYFASLVFMPILYFIIGAIVGWIIGKIKSK